MQKESQKKEECEKLWKIDWKLERAVYAKGEQKKECEKAC